MVVVVVHSAMFVPHFSFYIFAISSIYRRKMQIASPTVKNVYIRINNKFFCQFIFENKR